MACVVRVQVPLEEKDTKGPVGDMGDRLGVRSVATNPYGNTKVQSHVQSRVRKC